MTKRTLPKGIYLRGNKYVAQARLNKKQIQLGTFNSLEEAVTALDQGIGRALQGLDSIKPVDRYIDRLKTFKNKVPPHEDDETVIELFQLYIIVKAATPYSAWMRNSGLPAIVTLDLAKRYLMKRGIHVVSLEDFRKLHLERLARLTEPWLKDYKILGPGPKKNTLEMGCKGCGKLSLIKVGDEPVSCECGTAETILYFSRGIDGTVYVSIGPARPDNVLGCLYVPRGASVPLPVGPGFELALDAAPPLNGVERVLETPYIDKKLDFLEKKEEDVTNEDELDAYSKLLESKMFDLDDEFEFEGNDEVSRKLMEEDLKEISEKSASDKLKQETKKK